MKSNFALALLASVAVIVAAATDASAGGRGGGGGGGGRGTRLLLSACSLDTSGHAGLALWRPRLHRTALDRCSVYRCKFDRAIDALAHAALPRWRFLPSLQLIAGNFFLPNSQSQLPVISATLGQPSSFGAKFSGQTVSLRKSPTVFALIPMPDSTSKRI